MWMFAIFGKHFQINFGDCRRTRSKQFDRKVKRICEFKMLYVNKTAQKFQDIYLWVCPCRDDSASSIVFTGQALRLHRKKE